MNSKKIILIFAIWLVPFVSHSQEKMQKQTSPSMAFLKSVVFPGWGHFSLGPEHQMRGYIHAGSEIVLLLSYFGISTRNSALTQNMYAHVAQHAGTSIQGRDRAYQLAVGQFSSIEAYNNFMELNRNWASFMDVTAQNRWQWSSEKAQADYIRLRNEIDANDQQLPFLVSAMIGNRVLSGISAFIRARAALPVQAELSMVPITTNRTGLALRVCF